MKLFVDASISIVQQKPFVKRKAIPSADDAFCISKDKTTIESIESMMKIFISRRTLKKL